MKHRAKTCGDVEVEVELGNGTRVTLLRSPAQPNIRTYSSVIDAWSRSTLPLAARRAQAILDEMEKLWKETGDTSIQPNTVTYCSVINAHARSRDMTNKASAALQVLKRMQNVYESGINYNAKPTIVAYNSVLNACATTYGTVRRNNYNNRQYNNNNNNNSYEPGIGGDYTSYESSRSGSAASFDGGGGGGGEHSSSSSSSNFFSDSDNNSSTIMNESQSLALSIVKMLYSEVMSPESCIRPDHFTYGTVLKACANLMSVGDEEATAFIREVFLKCCADGQVSFGVCFQLRQAAPVDVYRELIPEGAMDAANGHFLLDQMPKEWSRNLNENKRYVKRYR